MGRDAEKLVFDLIGLLQSTGLLLGFFIEPGIINGDGGLTRECGEEINLLVAEPVFLFGEYAEDTERFALGGQGNSEVREEPMLYKKFRVRCARVGLNIGDRDYCG